jgi:hypothetical protein
MAANDPRLVQLLKIQNRRRKRDPINTGFPKNPGKPPLFKPGKQGVLPSSGSGKRERY